MTFLFLGRSGKPFHMRAGMSLIEVVVMTAIMGVLTTVLIGGFPVFNVTTYAKKEAERLALDLRASQNNAILGRVAQGTGTVPDFWGTHVDLTVPGQYILFAAADSNGNKKYDPGIDVMLEVASTNRFENGVTIVGLTTDLTTPPLVETTLDFVFPVPYGDTQITDTAGNTVSWGKVMLATTKTAYKRAVTMRVSGQISITPN